MSLNQSLINAVKNILACPSCKGSLTIQDNDSLACFNCGHDFSMENDVVCLLPPNVSGAQQAERVMREEVAKGHGSDDFQKIERIISEHHCRPVMIDRARHFKNKFGNGQWIIDVGCGTGYYWKNAAAGAKLILMDFALNNLITAKSLLNRREDMLFVQADASQLPLQDHVVSGVWSVQVTQHFPEAVMKNFLQELKRVLKDQYLIEVYNLNPDLLHKAIGKLRNRNFHIKGQSGPVELNKLNSGELMDVWKDLTTDATAKIGYSELFFHPDLRLKIQNEVVKFFESAFNVLPPVSRLFARQVQIVINKGMS